MKAPAFELPEDADVASLLLERMHETSLKPDSPVICINRGRRPLENMTFNGEHVTLPVGLFEIEYRAAQHFRDRAVVPGTRNLEVGGHVSWIGIIGPTDRRMRVDPPELCEPFTDEELANFGESLEAIDRKAMTGPDRFVTPVRTQTARAMSRSQGAGLKTQISADVQVSEAAAEAAEHVMDPPLESATRQAEAEAGRRDYGEPESAGEAPAPRPMRARGRSGR